MKIQKATGLAMDTITYIFANGSKQSQPINQEAFFDQKGKRRSQNEMIQLFQQTAWDRNAVSFSIDAQTSEEQVTTSELVFTSKERKIARMDYKQFRKSNPEGFTKSRGKFRAEFFDKLSSNKRLKFNLKREGVSQAA